MPLLVLLTVAGDQMPLMPLLLIAGKVGTVVPAQKGAMAVKVGVVDALTVTFKVVFTAHCPGLGVKV